MSSLGVGWLFGKEVNRQRADQAEKQADEAQKKAETETTKGAHLAGLVISAEPRLEAQGAGANPAVKYARDHYHVP